MLIKRNVGEMITHFNDVLSAMDISIKDKMTILGMITAIGYEYKKAADATKELSKPKWIPVTDEKRLPRDGSNVIVCTKSGNVGEAKYQAAVDYDLDFPAIWFLLNDYGNQYRTEELIAWQPLPTPPKEQMEKWLKQECKT